MSCRLQLNHRQAPVAGNTWDIDHGASGVREGGDLGIDIWGGDSWITRHSSQRAGCRRNSGWSRALSGRRTSPTRRIRFTKSGTFLPSSARSFYLPPVTHLSFFKFKQPPLGWVGIQVSYAFAVPGRAGGGEQGFEPFDHKIAKVRTAAMEACVSY